MLRKLLAAATAVVAVVGIVGLASPALAAGSDDPVPYTVTATSLTLPSGSTFASSSPTNDGNVAYIPISQYTPGETYLQHGAGWNIQNINFHIEQNPNTGKAMIGRSTLPFDRTASDGAFRGQLPAGGYCIVWVQVDGFNEHFGEGGQAPICSGAEDASASVSTTSASCDTAETVTLGSTTNASWGAPTRTTGPGDYSVTATATAGHLFSDGSATRTFTGTLAGRQTSGCDPQTVTIQTAPSYEPATCSADGSLVVPAQTHIVWSGGTDGAGPGRYTVVAAIAPADTAAYTLGAQQTSWTIDVPAAGVAADGAAMDCQPTVTPAAPTAVTDVTCAADGAYTLPADADVIWDVTREDANGATTSADVAPGHYRPHALLGDVTVTVHARPASGVQFAPDATTRWVFRFTAPADCELTTHAELPVQWTHTDAVCTAGGTSKGTITAGTADVIGFVAYTIDGAAVTAGTPVPVAAGDHVLVATPVDPSDTVDQPGAHTIAVAAASGICATDLTTLALTGSDPTGWILGAAALLLLGFTFVAIGLVRSRTGRRTV